MHKEGAATDQASHPEKASQTARVPIYKVEAPGQPIDDAVIKEIERATLVTFDVLGADIRDFEQGFEFEDLVDVWATDERNWRSFPRKQNTNADVMVVVVSTQPIYDYKGRELTAVNTASNVQFINLRKIDDVLAKDADKVPLPIKAGIAMVEEAIHYIQIVRWGRERIANVDERFDSDSHIKHKVEAEAVPLKKIVLKALYPFLDIKVKGFDY